ncbi:hypothetical protein DH09_20490 [Bacillaceae bacterium JMAK1]|nr:hypothetical protein DH09_20490 [Bacillaceae bacterium JMAK1]
MTDALDRKIETYINHLFKNVGSSQEAYEMKEELFSNMKEKISDYKSRGLEEDQAFKEAKASLGDLSGLIEDLQRSSQEEAKQNMYTSKSARISKVGIVASAVLILFGTLTSLMLVFMDLESVSVVGPNIFTVSGGALLVYSILTIETTKRYAMHQGRAALYALAIGTMLFAVFVGFSAGAATGEMFIAISSLMVFLIAGFALWLGLLLSGRSRKKQ